LFCNKNIEVIGLDTEAFDDLLTKRDHPNSEFFREFWVSLDDVYPQPTEACESKYNISITRYVRTNWEDIDKNNDRDDMGRGPRPESESSSVDDQVRDCVNEYHRTLRERGLKKKDFPLVLIDDGTFNGKTIIRVLKRFAIQGESFTAVRLGVAHYNGIDAIAEWSEADVINKAIYRVPFIGASKLCPPLKDWVCERDFFPGVLYGGRVVGEDKQGHLVPLRVDGLPVRTQYLYGWGKPIWASIEEGEIDFTIKALQLSIELWTYLETEVLKRVVRVKHLPAMPLKLYGDYQKSRKTLMQKPWLKILVDERENLIRIHGDPSKMPVKQVPRESESSKRKPK
jgi:hypothetical protein